MSRGELAQTETTTNEKHIAIQVFVCVEAHSFSGVAKELNIA
jgi:hypothetical protein